MGVGGPAAGLRSLSSELFALLLQQIPSSKDRHSLFCTCTAVRDTLLQAVGLPQGPQLTHSLDPHASALQDLGYEQQCMHLWLKAGPRLHRACHTAVRATGRVQLAIHGYTGPPTHITEVTGTSAQLTQLMAVGSWQHLTVIHLKSLLLDQLVPEVLTRHCPHLHTLHLVPTCRLLGVGVPTDVWECAKEIIEDGNQRANRDFNLQQHVHNCPSRIVLSLLRPTPCPQVRHLTLDVRSVWLEVEELYEFEVVQSIRYLEDRHLTQQMDTIWDGLEPVPRGIIRLKLAALAASQRKEQQQLNGAAAALEAAWQDAHNKEVQHFKAALTDLQCRRQEEVNNHEKQQPDGSVDWGVVSDAVRTLRDSDAPQFNTGVYSSSESMASLLKQQQLLQSGLVLDLYAASHQQEWRFEAQINAAEVKFETQEQKLDEWMELHAQLVRCRDNAQYAQHLHKALQPQVQQQLAALPNLSSLHIKEGAEAPPGLAEGVLQLGSQITALKLGTARVLATQLMFASNKSKSQVMPQQLSSVCLQLTNLQLLQWDAAVDDEGMRHLLKLPHLQHVTLVTNLSQSFADAHCNWQTLATMHNEPLKGRGISTCKQLAYLPLAALHQPVRVEAYGRRRAELYALTSDPAADLAIVKQACSNVARCGGVSWVCDPEAQQADRTRIVLQPYGHHSHPGGNPTLQRLQVFEASLPLLRGCNVHTVAVECEPLTDVVLSVLAPHLTAWGVHTLDIRSSTVCKDFVPHLLTCMPASISEVMIYYRASTSSSSSSFDDELIVQMCAGATRSITLSLTNGSRTTDHYNTKVVAKVAEVNSLVQLKLR